MVELGRAKSSCYGKCSKVEQGRAKSIKKSSRARSSKVEQTQVEQGRARSSKVEQGRARSSKVEQGRARSSKVERSSRSSKVEQGRASRKRSPKLKNIPSRGNPSEINPEIENHQKTSKILENALNYGPWCWSRLFCNRNPGCPALALKGSEYGLR